jgi:hypothetical protein
MLSRGDFSPQGAKKKDQTFLDPATEEING